MSNRISRLFPSGRRRASTTEKHPHQQHPKPLKHHLHSALAVGAVVALAGVAATGFTAQSAAAAEATEQATAQLVQEAIDQNSDKRIIFEDRTNGEAAIAATTAHGVIAAAQGKADAAALAASVTALEQADDRAPIQLLQLVSQVETDTAAVQGAIAEADRVAAEAAAAAQAAAAAKAAEEAAAKRSSSSGSSGGSAVNVSPGSAQAIARDMMASQYGWGEDQFNCLVKLWQKESRWDVNAYNSSSGATGIPQALPGSKMATAGADWKTNPATQIKWGLGYIAGSYGDPCSAWATSQAKGWY